MSRVKRQLVLFAVAGAAVIIAILAPKIPQDPLYHDFADENSLLLLPNALNVLSNLLFVWAGVEGLYRLLVQQSLRIVDRISHAYVFLFASFILVALGSGVYHRAPDNLLLAWDRAPMTIAFMSFFTIILAERVSVESARKLYPLLLLAGLGSIVYWHYSELAGAGDLRPYALVQFLPMLLIPLMLLLFKPRFSCSTDIWWVLGWYAVAKICEVFDHEIYQGLGLVSGHSLKHLAAGIACLVLLRHLRRREPVLP